MNNPVTWMIHDHRPDVVFGGVVLFSCTINQLSNRLSIPTEAPQYVIPAVDGWQTAFALCLR
jgi:hypothetical protein